MNICCPTTRRSQKAGHLFATVSKLLVGGLSSFTLGTVNFLFMFFVLLCTMYFFQVDGDKHVRKLLFYLPMKSCDENLMLEKFTSVTRATLKGTRLIGLLQGGLESPLLSWE
jgi:predicted PurR-regulated permease PerM